MTNKLTCVLAAFILFLFPNLIYAQPGLGTAANFAVFTSNGQFKNTNATNITGNIGVNVGSLTGFPPGIVIGIIHTADPATVQAASDLQIAYNAFSALTCGANGVLGVTLGNGQIITPGNYCIGAASTLNGNLILDAQGDPNAIFIFNLGGAFATSTLSSITLKNSASLCNIYWRIGGAVTLGSNSSFLGTILADGQIQLLSGASLAGRVLTRAGAVILDNNQITGVTPPVASMLTASGPVSFCAGGSVTISGNIGGVFNTGEITPSITVMKSGDYFVTNTGTCGAVMSNHIIVKVNPLPTPTVTPSGPVTICPGGSVVLTSSTASSYLWSTGATTQSITVATAGNYSVTVTDANGCMGASAPVTVTVNPSATPTISANGPLVFCQGGSVILTSSTANGYMWSTGATTQSITVTASGTFTVTTTGNCAGTSAPVTVKVNPSPTPTVTPSGPTTFCQGGSVVLTSSTASSYKWSTNATTQSITVNSSGTYTVTVTDANGCQGASAPVNVTVNPLPKPTVTPSGQVTICPGGSVVLTSSTASSYLWSTGATTQSITVATAGNYSVTVTDANGCMGASAPVTVTVNPSATPTISANGPLVFCQGGSVILTSSTANGYMWSTGATTQSITVTASGTFTVTTTGNCAGTSAPVTVKVNPSPTPTVTPSGPTTFCQGGSVVLTSSTASSYLWSTNATTQNITVNSSGTYTVTVTDANGCQGASAPVTVTVNQCGCINPNLITLETCNAALDGISTTLSSITDAGITCTTTTYKYIGAPAIITVMGPMLMASAGTNFQWFLNGVLIPGATQQMYFPTTFGNYTVQITNIRGCVSISQLFRSEVDYGDNCPSIHKNFCAPCDDGNPNTINDRVRNDCKCRGDFFSPNMTVKCPKDTIVLTTDPYGTVVNWKIAFSTNCKLGTENWVDVVQTSGYYNGYPFPPNTQTQIEYVGSDMCGNKSSCSFMVRTTPLFGVPILSAAAPDVSIKPGIANKILFASSIQARVFPNPVKSSATIEFSNQGDAAHLKLEVFNTNGEIVARLFDGEAATNELYNVKLDAANLSNGIYFYRITGGTDILNGRIVLLK